MPNVPPQGVLAARRSPGETPVTGSTVVVDAKATLPGENTPRQVIEIWAGNAAGAKRLVWVAKPDGPASATAAWIAASSVMRITWVPLNPVRHDRYSIVRPDGTLAGTVPQGATSFDDPSPRALNGAYKVVAQLEAFSDVTPTLTNVVNLTVGPPTCAASFDGDHVHVAWTHPVYGRPPKYRIYREPAGTFMAEIDGASVVWDEAHVSLLYGESPSYRVVPTFPTGESTGVCNTSTVAIPPLDPVNVTLSTFGQADMLQLGFSYPGGAIARYEVQRYDINNGIWQNHDLNNTSGASQWFTTTNSGYMRVRSIGVNGLASNYVQAGPVSPIVPGVLLNFYGLRPGQPAQDRAIGNIEPAGVVVCGEFYWANFPGNGWQTSGYITGTRCQTNDGGTPPVWDVDRLQSSPTYFRIARLRNGIYSAWTQYGPV